MIRTFALYRRHRAPDARLTLVGDPISAPYVTHLRGLADALSAWRGQHRERLAQPPSSASATGPPRRSCACPSTKASVSR